MDHAGLSIHAPTRGATTKLGIIMGIMPLSIHAPTRGATIAFEFWTRAFYLSIHAPTRGATAKMHNIPYASLQ